jgi:hypothetical protein
VRKRSLVDFFGPNSSVCPCRSGNVCEVGAREKRIHHDGAAQTHILDKPILESRITSKDTRVSLHKLFLIDLADVTLDVEAGTLVFRCILWEGMRHLRAFLVEARTTAAHGVSELMLYSGERFVASADPGYAVLPLFDISVGEVKTKAKLGQWRQLQKLGSGKGLGCALPASRKDVDGTPARTMTRAGSWAVSLAVARGS